MVTARLGKACANAAALTASAAMNAMNLLPPPPTLAALENGPSLFHEGSAAFAVIVAVEALLDPRLAGGVIVILRRHLADDALRGAHRERRVRCDHLAVLARRFLQVGDRHHLVHQADAQRLLGAELARGDHDLAREGGADELDELLHRAGAVAEAHLCRRDAETRIVGGDADIAAAGDVQA